MSAAHLGFGSTPVAVAVRGLEAKHGPQTALDGAMVLLNPVVQISTCPTPDGFRRTSRPISQSVCRVARQDGFAIGLTVVDDDPLGRPRAGLKKHLAVATSRC